jgi:hypothetical protein
MFYMFFRHYILLDDENGTQEHQKAQTTYKPSFGPNYARYGCHVTARMGPYDDASAHMNGTEEGAG